MTNTADGYPSEKDRRKVEQLPVLAAKACPKSNPKRDEVWVQKMQV